MSQHHHWTPQMIDGTNNPKQCQTPVKNLVRYLNGMVGGSQAGARTGRGPRGGERYGTNQPAVLMQDPKRGM